MSGWEQVEVEDVQKGEIFSVAPEDAVEFKAAGWLDAADRLVAYRMRGRLPDTSSWVSVRGPVWVREVQS